MHPAIQDLRYGVRRLSDGRGVAATAILTLALGIAATTTVFSVVDAVLLQPLPFPDSDRLVMVWEYNPGHPLKYMFSSPPNYADWRSQSTKLEQIAVFRPRELNLVEGGEAERVRGAAVSGNLFETLRIPPLLGRTLTLEDDLPGSPGAAVVSYGFWQRRLGGSADIVGRALRLDGEPFSVVGVMPQDFEFPVPVGLPTAATAQPADVWIPFRLSYATGQRGAHFMTTVGRLRDGTSMEQAETEMIALAGRLSKQHPATNADWSVRLIPLHQEVVSRSRPALIILMGAVALVLLIACTNAALMQLARAAGRTREISIRTALGASPGRLVRMLLAESLALSVLAGALGVALAYFGLNAVKAVAPSDLPRLAEVSVDGRVLGFAVLVSVLTGVAFGLVPAVQASRPPLADGLKEGARGSAGAGMGLRSLLAAAEMALSVVLLVGAGLLLKSLLHLQSLPLGFRPEHVMTLSVSLPAGDYDSPEKRAQFFERLLPDLEKTAGIEAAGAVMALPLATNRQGTGMALPDKPETAEQAINVTFSMATTGYFRAMGIPVRRGRDFRSSDTSGAPRVVVVNDRLARQFLDGERAVGRRVELGISSGTFEVVGVVPDVVHDISEHAEARPHVYLPYSQTAWAVPMSITVRSSGEASSIVAAVRQCLRRIDSTLPLSSIQSMGTVVSRATARPRFAAGTLTVFGGASLTLAAIGIYGVMSYLVGRRRREMAIRISLGARRTDIMRLILGQGAKWALAGAAAGLAGALALTRLLESQLYGVSALDPVPFLATPLILMAAAMLACFLPARRAARTDPIDALRCE